jgi:nucleoside-diphosphate-sugar epimerase
MTTLIIGCGFLGRRVGRRLHERGETVLGTVRSAARAGELRAWGVEPILADVLCPETLDALPAADRAVYCVGFDRAAGVAMRDVYVSGLHNALDRLAGRVGKLVYASSTSVYGQDDGGWVDESSPTAPRHEAGRVVLEAEEVVGQFAEGRGLPTVVLRFSGLYGPGRVVRREAIGRGEAIVGDPDRFVNWIHVHDAAAATVAALDRGRPGRLTLVSDDRPVTRREYYERLAEELCAVPPRFQSPTPGSPESRRDEANKRVSNGRLRAELLDELAFPDITTGLAAALTAD